jgi:hypothetical protein
VGRSIKRHRLQTSTASQSARITSITPIANCPTKLRIFETNASSYWQVRCFLKGKTYTQSLRTTNKQAAISQVTHFFHIKTADL